MPKSSRTTILSARITKKQFPRSEKNSKAKETIKEASSYNTKLACRWLIAITLKDTTICCFSFREKRANSRKELKK